MPKTYAQKDLGYPRSTTTAMFRVQMEDMTKWDVPVQIIADSRDDHYREECTEGVE